MSSRLPPKKLAHRAGAALPEQELMPGDVALAWPGQRLKTLLGSCVAVILTDAHRSLGCMCHIVHSSSPNSANLHNTAYATCAMDRMFHLLRQAAVAPTQCVAYVYGGGNMFPHLHQEEHVGQRNAQWALNFLHAHQIGIVAQAVGGASYRKIAWTVGPGEPELISTDVTTGALYER